MYPNLENEVHKMESNCTQIFAKENCLEKRLNGKLHRSTLSSPRRIAFCGWHIKRNQLWVLTILSILFVISFMGVAIMWWTSYLDNYILSHLILLNNSAAFSIWKDPPIKALMKVHIFNYTNTEAFERGQVKKLHVDDVGPFVYEESTHKTNVQFYSNGTISYQEFRAHSFRPDLSQNRRESDRIMVPNLSVLGAAAVSKDSFYVTRVAVSTLLRGLNADPFLNLAAHRFIWGYDDNVFELAKALLSFQKKLPFEKFGLMALRNGTSEDVITVHSGMNDFSKIAQIDRVNGENDMHHWSTQDCNQIKGSDGALYPIYEIRQKKPVNIYFKEVCRRIPLIYKEDVKIMDGKILAYRYGFPDTIFDRPDVEPKNQCFCNEEDTCSPRGVFNVSKCAFGAPASISFPHFYQADPALQQAVTGLEPDPEKHSSHVNIHPTMGFPMSGTYRLQVNAQVKRSFGMSQLDMFDDDIFLPIAWIEAGIDAQDLPEFAKDAILKTSVTLPNMEMAFKYGFLLMAVTMFVSISFILLQIVNERKRQRIHPLQMTFIYS